MADYIYSELINNLVSLNFDGVSNENAEIHVDNLHRLIEAIIKKTPGSLTIVDPSGRESIFDGSQDISITLSDRHLKSVKVNQCEKDNTPIEGLLVGDYYFDFEMIDRGNGYIYHLYCSAKMLTSLVDDEKERAINRENEIERNLNQEIARAQQEEINLNNYIDSAISSVYKAQGSATVGDLNSLTVTKEMNGYVYDISDNGILTKGSIQVINGDNVIIIWNEDENDWKWDRLSGIVDLSNYATKTYVDKGLSNKANLNDVYDKTTSDARYLPIYPYEILASGKSKATIKNALNKIEYPDVTREVIAWSIIQRDNNGRAQIAEPDESNDIANKQYVDNGLAEFKQGILDRLVPTINNKVDLSSDQTITGVKRFSNMVYIGNYDNDYISITNGDLSIRATNSLVLRSGNNNIIPYTNNSIDLGSSNLNWKDLYLSDGTILKNPSQPNYWKTIGDSAGNYILQVSTDNSNYSNVLWVAPNQKLYTKDHIPTSNNIFNLGINGTAWKDLYLSGNVILSSANANYKLLADGAWFDIKRDNTTVFQFYDTIIKSPKDNYADLGVSGNRWKNLYLAGNISDGTNSVSVSDIANGTFNVINASDIVNNTLTQEQYNLITNGKPTLIKGTWSTYNNLILLSPRDNSTYFEYLGIDRYKTTKIVVYNDKRITTSSAAFIQLQNIDWINGKAIPGYPSNTGTFNLKQIDGTLTWTKEWYGTQAEYDALGTYDNNTIYNIIEE